MQSLRCLFLAEYNFRNKYTSCCCEGKIKLPPIQPPPPYIKELLKGESEDGRIFYRKARAFNTKVSFASVSLKEDQYNTFTRCSYLKNLWFSLSQHWSNPPKSRRTSKIHAVFFFSNNNQRFMMTLTSQNQKARFYKNLYMRLKSTIPFFKV